MEGTVQINNCGVYKNVPKRELCGVLLKNTPRYYEGYPRVFYTELDTLISKLQETVSIQIYKTGVVRLFFEHGHFEERHTIYLRELTKEVLEILGNI